MVWVCPRCQSKCEGDYCYKCGQQNIPGFNVNVPVHNATVPAGDPAIAELRSSVKTLKILCFVLIGVVAFMSVLFALAYYSVWENIEDLWINARDLWDNAEELWESSEGLWERNNYYYYWY